MEHKLRLREFIAGLALVLIVAGVAAAAAGGVRADVNVLGLTWWTVDSGGGTSSGGSYSVSGTLGQHAAGALSGGRYTLPGGF